MIIALTILCLIQFAAIGALSYYCYKFGTTIIKFQESIEESLDMLDERYNSITKVLEIPLFYDSPEIRRVVDDVRESREVLLKVASKIGNVEDVKDEEET